MTTRAELLVAAKKAYESAKGQWTDMSWPEGCGPWDTVICASSGAVNKEADLLENTDEANLDERWSKVLYVLEHYKNEIVINCDGPADYLDALADPPKDEEELESMFAHMSELAHELRECAEYIEEIESSAKEAEEQAALAAECLDEGEWQEAAEYAKEAAHTERQYGDAPTWGNFAALCEELAEF